MSAQQPLDHDKLLAEIDEEVKRRRQSGDIPADLERELDLVFARFAPVDALEADFEQVLTRAEQATFIDVLAPVESSRPVVPYFKKIVRKVVGWYLRYVAQQTTSFAHAVTRAVRLLGERVDALEEASPLAASKEASADPAVLAPWTGFVVERLRGTTGRVLHGESGNGHLVDALVKAGVDAYGVDPSTRDEVAVHLRALPEGSLGALVLSGCVDYLPLGAQLHLADLAGAKLAPGGVVIVVSQDPRAWERAEPNRMADLAPGRPLRSETWRHLLTERGLEGVDVVEGERPTGLQAVPKAHKAMAENIERLNDMLFGPSSYAVVGIRPA
ncbi:MAG TPA: methyltransferase domain-containing protein [Acidimicrobiales bacterium]|jgi:hypothetical protein|nr:methyltransferase domain-containing protein [Acidimicrobiales bacterium]